MWEETLPIEESSKEYLIGKYYEAINSFEHLDLMILNELRNEQPLSAKERVALSNKLMEFINDTLVSLETEEEI